MKDAILIKQAVSSNTLRLALLLAGAAFAMVVIVYGMDSIVKGAHDVFHDFRHVAGFPCH